MRVCTALSLLRLAHSFPVMNSPMSRQSSFSVAVAASPKSSKRPHPSSLLPLLTVCRQVYGPAATSQPDDASPSDPATSPKVSSRTPSCIPKLQPEFFGSPFYRRFHIQRPIVDPTEFSARFYESEQGKPESLGVAGGMICMLLGKLSALCLIPLSSVSSHLGRNVRR